MTPPIRILADGIDFTDRAENITFSNVDPGGMEACSFSLPYGQPPRKGRRIEVQVGGERGWFGRVGEAETTVQHQKGQRTVGGEGYGAALKTGRMPMIYIDRDLSQFKASSVTRQVAQAPTTDLGVTAFTPVRDDSGNPGLLFSVQNNTWPGTWISEAWYDAGPGNVIARADFLPTVTTFTVPDANLTHNLRWNAADSGADDSNDLVAGNGVVQSLTNANSRRFVCFQFGYAGTGGTAGKTYGVRETSVSLHGNHGLTVRGADYKSYGYYPQDVALDAFTRAASGLAPGVIDAQAAYIAPHIVYRIPVPHEQIISEMATLLGWHYGTWEPASMLSDTARFDFRQRPSSATCFVSAQDCDGLTVSDRLQGYANVAKVRYSNPAGDTGVVTVTASVPALDDAGITNVIDLDLGTGSSAAATTHGQFILALTNRSGRAAGSCTLPDSVKLPGGGSKPACLIRAGLDRIRITDLPTSVSLFDDTQNTFRVSRVETTVDSTGRPVTRVDFDDGANLIETLTARETLALQAIGAG